MRGGPCCGCLGIGPISLTPEESPCLSPPPASQGHKAVTESTTVSRPSPPPPDGEQVDRGGGTTKEEEEDESAREAHAELVRNLNMEVQLRGMYKSQLIEARAKMERLEGDLVFCKRALVTSSDRVQLLERAGASYDNQLAARQAEIDSLQERVEKLRSILENARMYRDKVRSAMRKRDDKIKELEDVVADLRLQLEAQMNGFNILKVITRSGGITTCWFYRFGPGLAQNLTRLLR